jgi:hypothetical protein
MAALGEAELLPPPHRGRAYRTAGTGPIADVVGFGAMAAGDPQLTGPA